MPCLKRNLPVAERVIRLALALAVAVAAGAGWPLSASFARWVGVAAAAGLALTALVGVCPACALAGRRAVGR